MKNRIQFFSFLATLAVVLGMVSWGSALHAQNAPSTPTDQQAPQQQQPNPPADQAQPQQAPAPEPPAAQQPPSTQNPNQAQTPDQTPDSKTVAPSAADSQTFTGTVVKSGDKYVLKDDAGHTYDIDHQAEVKKFEGKRIKVQGTLDPTGTVITVK